VTIGCTLDFRWGQRTLQHACHLESRALSFCLVQSCFGAENSRMSTITATEFLPLVATASAARDFIVVSLHDIAPSTQQIANTIISELAHRGVRVCSLLVVPDYHHEGLFTADRQFVSWLRGLEAEGNEIVIHGYFHERPRRAKETLRDKFLTRLHETNSVRTGSSHKDLWRLRGCLMKKRSALHAMPRWNTRQGCAPCVIYARERCSPQEH